MKFRLFKTHCDGRHHLGIYASYQAAAAAMSKHGSSGVFGLEADGFGGYVSADGGRYDIVPVTAGRRAQAQP